MRHPIKLGDPKEPGQAGQYLFSRLKPPSRGLYVVLLIAASPPSLDEEKFPADAFMPPGLGLLLVNRGRVLCLDMDRSQ